MADLFKLKLVTDTKQEIVVKPFSDWSPAIKATIESHNTQLLNFCEANQVREQLLSIATEHVQVGVSKQLLKPLDTNPKFLQLAQGVAIFLYKMFSNFTVAVAQEDDCLFVYPDGKFLDQTKLKRYLEYKTLSDELRKQFLNGKGMILTYMSQAVNEFICSIALQYSLIQQKQKAIDQISATATAAIKSGGYIQFDHPLPFCKARFDPPRFVARRRG